MSSVAKAEQVGRARGEVKSMSFKKKQPIQGITQNAWRGAGGGDVASGSKGDRTFRAFKTI